MNQSLSYILWPFLLILGVSGLNSPLLKAQDEGDYEHFSAEATRWMRRNGPRALECANLAHQLAQDQRDRARIAESLILKGEAESHLGQYQSAYADYESALDMFIQQGNRLGEATAMAGLSVVAWRLGSYARAYVHQEEALRIRERMKDTAGLIQSHYWLGILQADVGEYSDARRYYRTAYELAVAMPDSQMIANILNFQGRSWRKQEVYDTALVLHEQSLAIYRALGDSVGISDYYNNVGSIYRRKGDFQRALEHFFRAITIQEKLEDREGLADGYNDIGTTFSQAGDYELAEKYLFQGLAIARETGLVDDVRYALESLATNSDLQGDYKSALLYFQQYTAVRDSIQMEQQSMQNQLLRRNFERQQEQEEALRKAQLKSLWAFWIGGALLAAIVGIFMWWRMRWQRRVNEELERKNEAIEQETRRSQALLHNILPVTVARELTAETPQGAIARSHPMVSVMFVDFAKFTSIASNMTPESLVQELHRCFRAFDEIIARFGLEKIKTIGDAYMCAGGLPEYHPSHAANTIRAALEIQKFLNTVSTDDSGQGEYHPPFQARIGIHSGPVVAGVVGTRKFAYDIWGDTVNTASRMETAGEVGRVNISADTHALVQTDFICQPRGKIKVKHKGEIEMYFVEWEI